MIIKKLSVLPLLVFFITGWCLGSSYYLDSVGVKYGRLSFVRLLNNSDFSINLSGASGFVLKKATISITDGAGVTTTLESNISPSTYAEIIRKYHLADSGWRFPITFQIDCNLQSGVSIVQDTAWAKITESATVSNVQARCDTPICAPTSNLIVTWNCDAPSSGEMAVVLAQKLAPTTPDVNSEQRYKWEGILNTLSCTKRIPTTLRAAQDYVVRVKHLGSSSFSETTVQFPLSSFYDIMPSKTDLTAGDKFTLSLKIGNPSVPFIVSLKKDTCGADCVVGPEYARNLSRDAQGYYTVPAGLTLGSDWRIFVGAASSDGSIPYNCSDNIAIQSAAVSVSNVTPSSGQFFIGGNITVGWICPAGVSDAMTVFLEKPNGTRSVLQKGLPNSGTVQLTIPTSTTPDAYWRVAAMHERSGKTGYAGGFITIQNTPVGVLKIKGTTYDSDNQTPLSNVRIRITGNGVDDSNTLSGSQGYISTVSLAKGIYTVTPTLGGMTFYPPNRTVSLSTANAEGINFYSNASAPIITLESPSNGASVSGDLGLRGVATATNDSASQSAITEIGIRVDGNEKAAALIISPENWFALSGLTWVRRDSSLVTIKTWADLLGQSGSHTVLVWARTTDGNVGYSPRLNLTLGSSLTVSITSPSAANMPILKGYTVNARGTVGGGVAPFTYDWRLDNVSKGSGNVASSTVFATASAISFVADSLLFKTLSLTVQDAIGNEGKAVLPYAVDAPAKAGDPDELGQASAGFGVNVVNGNLFFQRSDLQLPGVGLPIVFARTYNSVRVRQGIDDSTLGYGWSHSYLTRLSGGIYEPRVSVTWGDGSVHTWVLVGNQWQSASIGNFGVLSRNPDGTYQVADKDETVYWFDLLGRLGWVRDRSGNKVNLSYDSSGLLNRIINASGRWLSLAYETTGGGVRLTGLTDNANRTVSFSYDADGYLTGATDLRAKTENYTYLDRPSPSPSHIVKVLRTIVDKKGQTILTNGYGDTGVTSQQDALGKNFSFQFNAGETIVTNPLTKTTRFTIDAADRVTEIIDPSNGKMKTVFGNDGSAFKSYPILPTKEMAPNQSGASNPAAAEMEYSTEGRGNLTNYYEPSPNGDGSQRGPLHQYAYQVDAARNRNLMTDYVDPQGRRTSVAYTDQGLPQAITPPGTSSAIRYEYDSCGLRIASVRNRDGKTLRTSYEHANEWRDLTAVALPSGATNRYEYDAAGRMARRVDPMGKSTIYGWDGDLLLGMTYPIDDARTGQISYAYDHNGRLETITDDLGGVTRYVYDARGLKTQETNAAGEIRKYAYDDLGRLQQMSWTSSSANPVEYFYDDRGNLIRVRNVDLNQNQFVRVFDANGNLQSEADGLNRMVTYLYDNLSRKTRADYGDGTYETFDYNDSSKLIHHRDRNGGITDYGYDELDRLTDVWEPVEDYRKVSLGLGYDSVGNLIRMTDPRGKVTTFEYDEDNRMTAKVEDTYGAAMRYGWQYDAADRVSRATSPGGSYVEYAYYDSSWLRRLCIIT